MLPRVDAEEGSVWPADGILVRSGDNSQGTALLVLCQPCPAAALNSCERRVHLFAEGLERYEILVD